MQRKTRIKKQSKKPLFGSYKISTDYFEVPIRLYSGNLKNYIPR